MLPSTSLCHVCATARFFRRSLLPDLRLLEGPDDGNSRNGPHTIKLAFLTLHYRFDCIEDVLCL